MAKSCERRFGLSRPSEGFFERKLEGFFAWGLLKTSETTFTIHSVTIGTPAALESTVRKAFGFVQQSPAAYRRVLRLVRIVIVAPGEDSFRGAGCVMLDEDCLTDGVIGALRLYELGVIAWLAHVGGLTGTAERLERQNILALRALRRFYPSFLERIDQSEYAPRVEAELKERQQWLAESKIVRKRLGWARVAKT